MSAYQPPATAPRYLHIDERLLVVSKASGLLSVPGRGEHLADCLVARVDRDYPGARIVHRLDMATSGLLVLARDADTHRALSRLFETRVVGKRYEAVVAGELAADLGEVELPLICDWPRRPLQKVDFRDGKPALTRFRVLARTPGRTRVALEPHTGRSHQLRLHMRALGHPILGDELYGEAASAPRLLLHATTLEFVHPFTGERLHCHEDAPF